MQGNIEKGPQSSPLTFISYYNLVESVLLPGFIGQFFLPQRQAGNEGGEPLWPHGVETNPWHL